MDSTSTATHLSHLRLQNFRCFADFEMTFDPKLTVFVAPNGGGKTAVLDGVATALRLFVDLLDGRPASKGFDRSDIRRVLTPEQTMQAIVPVRLEAGGSILGANMEWNREILTEKASRTTTGGAQDLKALATKLLQHIQAHAVRQTTSPVLLPLVAFYGTGRLWSVGKLTEGKKTRDLTPNARTRGYTDCLASSSHYRFFADWFRRFSFEMRKEQQDRKSSPHTPATHLAVVRGAVDQALEPCGWNNLEWDFTEQRIVAHHEDFGRLPVDFLSDGIRTMIGLVADIAHRAARLNPHLAADAARQTPGIVLIDEVDMHLHPEWQQVVIQSLRDAFPLVQFVVTTHSPQVLSTVPARCIRMLEQLSEGKWRVDIPFQETRGEESATVLALVMKADPIPPVQEARWLQEYHALIQSQDFASEKALALRESLVNHFGEKHPLILDCDRMIRLERFKQELPRTSAKPDGQGD